MREEDSNWFANWGEALPSLDELIPSSQTQTTPQPPPQPASIQANPPPHIARDEPVRPLRRFVWTLQLHKQFVDTVEHLGINHAVVAPRTIMQHMNVEGLTRGEVASHLQIYRIRLKKMQSNRGRGNFGESGYLSRPSSLRLNNNQV